jgi:hypothetical protein
MPKSKKTLIELDDFIDPNIEIKIDSSINPKARLVDFSNIKIPMIEARVRMKIEERLEEIKKNLQKFRNTISS